MTTKADNPTLFDNPYLAEAAPELTFYRGGTEQKAADPIGRLRAKFGICPFSVLDARHWQPRKREWIKRLGIRSEAGRESIETAQNICSEKWTPGSETREVVNEEYYKDNPHRVDGHGLSESQGRLDKFMAKPPIPGGGGDHSIRRNINEYADRRKRDELPEERGYDIAGKENKDLSEEEKRALGCYFAPGGSTVGRGSGTALREAAKGHGPGTYSDSANRIAGGFHEADGTPKGITGTSVFDPVLCECVYRWFMPRTGGHVLDPFAGGSVRGLVAAMLGKKYTGIEFRPGQVDANREQADYVMNTYKTDLRGGELQRPKWIVGDSFDMSDILNQDEDEAFEQYDLVFACPPYYNLEIYSVDQKDGSAFDSYERFMLWFKSIFAQAVSRLREKRFAAIVVGEIRDDEGWYRNFEAETIGSFTKGWLYFENDVLKVAEGLGLKFYNRAAIVTAVGSLPVRIASQFPKYRKLGNTHQMLYVFYKGDNAKDILPELGLLDGNEFGNAEDMMENFGVDKSELNNDSSTLDEVTE